MGKLYIVPTPVGNFEDMTMRAIRVLKEADLILAEDTRTSSVLLRHFEITTPMQSHHKYNEHTAVARVMDMLEEGRTIALISDAGTPGISDPGFLLSRECRRQGVDVECLPGATAFVPALVDSGLPCDRFHFEGFLPVKKGRQTRLSQLAEKEETMVFYESPHRIVRTLGEFVATFGADREAAVVREISKKFETLYRSTLGELLSEFEMNKPKGEFVIIIDGKRKERPARKSSDKDSFTGSPEGIA
ncbi:MAG: 16S rRNA (cytidine(1402)-2'-O)-methyltransferase [Muribaculaceae bacterium]|nr:16S rRNA (cytidine(1402)-2'-O)-methyltransferase [Muribaculaceae bacterium]